MSETIESKDTNEVFVTSSTSGGVISSGELQNVQVAYRLNGKNYLKWSQLIKTFLKGKGKLSHLLGTGPKDSDTTFTSWDEENSLIMS